MQAGHKLTSGCRSQELDRKKFFSGQTEGTSPQHNSLTTGNTGSESCQQSFDMVVMECCEGQMFIFVYQSMKELSVNE